MTGLEWIRESGELTTPIGLTNTHSVGVVRDELVAAQVRARGEGLYWSLPVVGETYDGLLNDINGFHVRPEHVRSALADASTARPAEGNVGGGTGMICHGFKGGIGTSSRITETTLGRYTVGVLVQANYGSRELLRIDGVPVGAEIPLEEVPSPWAQEEAIDGPGYTDAAPGMSLRTGPNGGSIIVVVATDAPLLPHQCERLAQRVSLGLARMGSIASNGSGDIFIAFSTGNRGLSASAWEQDARKVIDARFVPDKALSPLFQATVEATEAAVVNALLAGRTMVGRDGITAHELDHGRLLSIMGKYGRPARPTG
jgi:D-aminopeptidase